MSNLLRDAPDLSLLEESNRFLIYHGALAVRLSWPPLYRGAHTFVPVEMFQTRERKWIRPEHVTSWINNAMEVIALAASK